MALVELSPADSQDVQVNAEPQPEPEPEPEPTASLQALRALRLWLADHRHCTATSAAAVAEALVHFFGRTGEFAPTDILGILQEMGDDAAGFISGVATKHAGGGCASSIRGSTAGTASAIFNTNIHERFGGSESEPIVGDQDTQAQIQPKLQAARLDSEALRVAVGRDRQRLLGMLQDAKPSLKKVKQTLKKLQQYRIDYEYLSDAADWLGASYVDSAALGRSELRNHVGLPDGAARPVLCVGCGDGTISNIGATG
jgi:hypothetical protein